MSEAQMPEKVFVFLEWVEGAGGSNFYRLSLDECDGTCYYRADIVAEMRKELDELRGELAFINDEYTDSTHSMTPGALAMKERGQILQVLKAKLATARREAIEEVLEATKFYSCTCFKTIEELLAKDAP